MEHTVLLAAAEVVEQEMSRVRGGKHATILTTAGSEDGTFSAICLHCGPIVGNVPMGIAQTWAEVHSAKGKGDSES